MTVYRFSYRQRVAGLQRQIVSRMGMERIRYSQDMNLSQHDTIGNMRV